MKEALAVFPHQLFAEHAGLEAGRPVYCVEEQLFFGDHRYQKRIHRQKLMLHRASLRAWADEQAARGYEVRHVPHSPCPRMGYLFDRLEAEGVGRLLVADPVDWALERRLRSQCGQRGLELRLLPAQGFLSSAEEARQRLGGSLRQTSFYIAQRKAHGLLLQEGKPLGGKWSLDAANRRRYDGAVPLPAPPQPEGGEHAREAEAHVAQHYPHAPGAAGPLRYPCTARGASAWLEHFLEHGLPHFGAYQDAMLQAEPFLFHSLLSSSLNIGLLDPRQVLEAALRRYQAGGVPLQSIEGFVRQILGWREFMRAVYEKDGLRQRSRNFFGHTRPMPASFYEGRTGVLPFDLCVGRVQELAYVHHIERLMVLGNFMLLCEIDPDAVYAWFMELFIDACDWVMVPNVYCMSQYADGGGVTTKPYISGSNYLRKMGDFEDGPWRGIWDGLFWRFVHVHAGLLADNPRTRPLTWGLGRMVESTLQQHLDRAEAFLADL